MRTTRPLYSAFFTAGTEFVLVSLRIERTLSSFNILAVLCPERVMCSKVRPNWRCLVLIP
jgi:hypothetical protein